MIGVVRVRGVFQREFADLGRHVVQIRARHDIHLAVNDLAVEIRQVVGIGPYLIGGVEDVVIVEIGMDNALHVGLVDSF